MTMRKVLVLSSEKVATTCDNAKSIPFEMLRFNLKCSVSNKQATSNAGAYQVAYQTVGHLISKRLREGSERLREAPGTAGTYQVAYQTVRHLISKMLRAGQRRSVFFFILYINSSDTPTLGRRIPYYEKACLE